MLPTQLTPLPQLRAELETCPIMDSHLSLLLGLRRVLVRHYNAVSPTILQAVPAARRRDFHRYRQALMAPAPFPAPSWAEQYAQTEQALALLEALQP